MNQDQRLQHVANVLREKVSQFDTNKERSKEQILVGTQALRNLINTVEADLLRKIDRIFGENPFAAALCDFDNNNGSTSDDYNRLEEASREAVPPVTGPANGDFFEVQKAIFELKNFDRKQREVQLVMAGRAASFNAIVLSWDSVPSAVAYQVEERRPSNSAFGKVYEGNSLSYTVAGLEPGTRYLFHLRAVAGDGAVSEWSKKIEVITQEAPVPCNVTARAVSCNTVSVSWSPVPAEGFSYKVCVIENTGNSSRSCIFECGQNTCYKPSGLLPSTKYSLCVQAGRGKVWSKWSSTVSVETLK